MLNNTKKKFWFFQNVSSIFIHLELHKVRIITKTYFVKKTNGFNLKNITV